MPMNPRLLRPISTTHPEAQVWRNAVIANGGTVSGSTLNAVSRFCRSIDAAGIRDRFYRLNLLCGNSDAAIVAPRVPLYRGPAATGTQYGNTIDSNSNFVQGDYSLTGGITGNGSTKIFDTGYLANTLAASNSHISVGLLATDTMPSGDRTIIGAWNGSNNVFEIRGRDTGGAVPLASAFTRFGTASDRLGDSVTSASLAAGNIMCAWPTMYRNGTASGTDATTSQDFPAATKVYIWCLNNSNTGTTNFSNARLGYYSLGATMTAQQAAAFSNAINSFYTAIGRS
jgi:hypothetical protein